MPDAPPRSIPTRPCEACGQPTRAYLNDAPFDIQLGAATAAAKGLKDGDIAEWAWGLGLTAWGIVRVVDAPAERWPTLRRKMAN